jgi:putative ABC transport system permease protein
MASLVALLVGMFLIYNTTSINVVQRRREIGTLRALGATRRDVLFLLTLEGVVLGVAGSTLGLVFGVGLARVMLDGMQRTVTEMFLPVARATVDANRMLLGGAWALGVVATKVAAIFPAWSATRTSPIETLRSGSLVRVEPPRRRAAAADLAAVAMIGAAAALLRLGPIADLPVGAFAACLALVVAGALACPRLVQLVHGLARLVLRSRGGVEARLANENLPRDIGRTSATAAALMVGVAMATAFAGFVGSFESSTVDWVNQTLPADLWITSAARIAGGGASLPLSDELVAPLAAIRGVEHVERIRVIDLDYRGFPIKLVASDIAQARARIRLLMLEGTQDAAIRTLEAGGVVVAENFSRRFGVHLGDRITLATPKGPRGFDVGGVIVDYTSDTGVLMLDRPAYVDAWGDDRVDTYKLYLARGADPEPARRVIDAELGERYDLFVLTNREFRDEVISMLDQAFAVMHVLEGIAIVVSVLGVVNALLANVIERVRELAILRAVGMRRAQIARIVVVEGFLVGVVGVVGGVGLGLAIGHVLLGYINLAQTGWYLPFRPSWWSIAETALLVVAGATVSGWYPARHASRLVIAEALEYE